MTEHKNNIERKPPSGGVASLPSLNDYYHIVVCNYTIRAGRGPTGEQCGGPKRALMCPTKTVRTMRVRNGKDARKGLPTGNHQMLSRANTAPVVVLYKILI